MRVITWLVAAALLAASMSASAQNLWRPLDPANVLVIDSTKGRMLVEMRPDLAPGAVARIIMLARERVYDGLQFHRVVNRFVAQTGNPNNRDGGVSQYPNLAPEFSVRLNSGGLDVIAARKADGSSGFLGSVPIQAEQAGRRADGSSRAWGAYCTGVAGMGRQAARDSANSEIFFMLAPARSLDHEYTVWGRVIDGLPALQALAIGEPPATPDVMTRVRVLVDLPDNERPVVSLGISELTTRVQGKRTANGADFSVCDVDVPVRVSPPR